MSGPGDRRAERTALLLAAALTLLALLENTAAPWAPFYVLYATAAIVLPIRFRAVRFTRPELWWHVPAVVLLAAALQGVAAVQLTALQPALLGALDVSPDRMFGPRYFFPASLTAMLRAASARLPLEPVPLANAYFAFIVAWAGIGEELFYRGYLHGTLARRRGFATAAVVSSAFFALRHATQLALVHPYPWPAALSWATLSFVLGMVLAWLYDRTGSLTLPVVAHYAFNLIPFLRG